MVLDISLLGEMTLGEAVMLFGAIAMLFADAKGDDAAGYWHAVPGVLWFVFALVFLLVARPQLTALLSTLVWRLRSGAAVKIWHFEVGATRAVQGSQLTPAEEKYGARPDAFKVTDTVLVALRQEGSATADVLTKLQALTTQKPMP